MEKSESHRNCVCIEGERYSSSDINGVRGRALAQKSTFHKQLLLFLQEWFSESPTIRLHTSGSTGTPKEIIARKEQMMRSAKITCDFLGVQRNDKALLCLPLSYIAGKMMVVRAIYAGLDLYPAEPDGHPLALQSTPFDFAAMVPLQVYNSLQSDQETERLSKIKHLIIGGGAIDEDLEERLKDFPNAIYSTYGMTETLSHIALRQVSGTEATSFYTPLPSVFLSLSDENTLVIDAPAVSDTTLVTNDMAELLPDGRFRILGRKDNVINSGGIKIQIEDIEKILAKHLKGRFAITAVPHPKLGEAVTLLLEGSHDVSNTKGLCKDVLPRFGQPVHIFTINAIPHTGSGKIDRAAAKRLAKEEIERLKNE